MIVGGDRTSPDNFTVLEYVTMATTGNATDFGDANVAAKFVYGLGKGSTTRGVFSAAGDDGGSGGPTNAMSYITIASAGNSLDFGNLTTARIRGAAGNNSTRIVFSGGQVGNEVATNVMDYITTASLGNATDFGDTTETRMNLGGASNSTRSVFTGGAATGSSSSRKNTIDYITTASLGNAIDFGDLTAPMEYTTANSSSNPSQQNEAGFAPAAIGLFAGGDNQVTTISYVNIATTGNAAMFGDLTAGFKEGAGLGNATRAVFHLGYAGSITNVLEFIAISTKGKATDFGDLAVTKSERTPAGNATHGLFAGSTNSDRVNNIDRITIASAGNAIDHGDLTVARGRTGGQLNSTTLGVFAGGYDGGNSNVIDSVAFANAANATDFGDLTVARRSNMSASSSTRGLMGGGNGSGKTVIDYITFSSAANATDFGDLIGSGKQGHGSVSDSTKALFGGGGEVSIDTVNIASTGNATDFGDLLSVHGGDSSATASNSHGGLA